MGGGEEGDFKEGTASLIRAAQKQAMRTNRDKYIDRTVQNEWKRTGD